MLLNLNSKPFDGLRMTTLLLAGVIGFVTLAGMARPTTNDAQARGLEISARSDRSDRGFHGRRKRAGEAASCHLAQPPIRGLTRAFDTLLEQSLADAE